MKKVLIISFYFPPYTGIEGHRAYSWANNFKQFGLQPIVVTRHWEAGKQQSWSDYFLPLQKDTEKIVTENYTVYRTSHQHVKGYNPFNNSRANALKYWKEKIAGNFHIETDAYTSLKDLCEQILTTEKVDYILVSSPPLNTVKLGHVLSKKYNIPLCVDFRDTYNNYLLQINPVISKKERLEVSLFKLYLKKWLKDASLVTSVSQPALDLINELHQNKSLVIYNGFEKDLFETYSQKEKKEDHFIISILGNLYTQQDIDFMLRGFKQFLDICPNVLIQFIGTGTAEDIKKKILDVLPEKNLIITNRLERTKALTLARKSDILYYIGWKGFKGIYSGKIFEYLGLRKNILLAPSDNDVIESLLLTTKAGKACDSEEEMVAILKDWYNSWQTDGELQYFATEKVFDYTRENQARVLAQAILNTGNI